MWGGGGGGERAKGGELGPILTAPSRDKNQSTPRVSSGSGTGRREAGAPEINGRKVSHRERRNAVVIKIL